MKHYWFILYLLFIPSTLMVAQQASIVKDLNTHKQGQGDITIYQDESIEGLIGSKMAGTSSTNNNTNVEVKPEDTTPGSVSGSTSTVKPLHYKEVKGYKIQVFSGNEQRRSKSEAYAKKEQIQSSYPDQEVNVTFKSPVWRVRVGNYRTYEEAFETMKEMKQAFPAFGKEMQIVEAVIKLPVYN